MKKIEDKTMVKLFLFLFENRPFWAYKKKPQHIHFFGAWPFLLVHIQLTPSEGPKSFVIFSFF